MSRENRIPFLSCADCIPFQGCSNFSFFSLLSLAFQAFDDVCTHNYVAETTRSFNNAKEKVQRRLQLQIDRPDFPSHLSRSKQDLSETEIESTAAIIIIAGSNSTLAGTTNYLTKYPDTLKSLTNEIRRTFEDESDMTLESLAKLPYLSAVIEEGLRICAPVPLGMPRVVPEGGDTVCGEWLPAGVSGSF